MADTDDRLEKAQTYIRRLKAMLATSLEFLYNDHDEDCDCAECQFRRNCEQVLDQKPSREDDEYFKFGTMYPGQ